MFSRSEVVGAAVGARVGVLALPLTPVGMGGSGSAPSLPATSPGSVSASFVASNVGRVTIAPSTVPSALRVLGRTLVHSHQPSGISTRRSKTRSHSRRLAGGERRRMDAATISAWKSGASVVIPLQPQRGLGCRRKRGGRGGCRRGGRRRGGLVCPGKRRVRAARVNGRQRNQTNPILPLGSLFIDGASFISAGETVVFLVKRADRHRQARAQTPVILGWKFGRRGRIRCRAKVGAMVEELRSVVRLGAGG